MNLNSLIYYPNKEGFSPSNLVRQNHGQCYTSNILLEYGAAVGPISKLSCLPIETLSIYPPPPPPSFLELKCEIRERQAGSAFKKKKESCPPRRPPPTHFPKRESFFSSALFSRFPHPEGRLTGGGSRIQKNSFIRLENMTVMTIFFEMIF